MRNSWVRAWLASLLLLIAAGAIVRRFNSQLLAAEQPVTDWVLDGTDTSFWGIADVLFETWVVVVGTIGLSIVAFFFQRRVAFAIPLLMVFGIVAGSLTASIVGRIGPNSSATPGLSSFPNPEVVQIGVFLGLVLLVLWWLRTPKLVWQIGLEVTTVALLVASINRVVAGEAWPSDIVGSALVIGVTLVSAAILLERLPPGDPRDKEWAQAPRLSGAT